MTGGPARLVAGAAALSMLTVGLSGCSNSDALGLVRQACAHVQRSLADYGRVAAAPSPAAAAADRSAALAQLQDALPLAATAAGEDAEWQAFSATLSEGSRVPESDLVSALNQQCADAQSGFVPSTSTTTTVAPVPTNPEPVGR